VAGLLGPAAAAAGFLTPPLLEGAVRLPPVLSPVALADEWCETDPVIVIQTPQGNLVTVYYLTGVQGPLNVVGGLLSLLVAGYSVAPADGGTQVSFHVTVPNGLLGASYPTRVKVTSGALGTGTVYGSATGQSGQPLNVSFTLGVP
jgi:hypothetical protein